MKHRVLALLLGVLALACARTAAAQNATYVFPYEGFRYTQSENETVLTQTNIKEHEALLASLGTTSEAVLASYASSGIVMEVIPADGGQISVSVVSAGDFADVRDMAELDEARLQAFAAQFEESGMYESCGVVETEPVCVRLISSAMYGSMPVYSLRYATLHLGRLYLINGTIVGREPAQEDDERLARVLSGIKLLSSAAEPTAAPTSEPTPTPEPTPLPTPGIADLSVSEGELTVDGLPAYTTTGEIAISGTASLGETVRVLSGDLQLGNAAVRKDGTYALRFALPDEGRYRLDIVTESAKAQAELVYEMPRLSIEILEPTEWVSRNSNVTLRGVTQAEANITISGPSGRLNVKANKAGAFSAHLKVEEEGEHTFAILARAKGYEDGEATITIRREFTDREKLNAFRRRMISLTYDNFAAEPEKYEGKAFLFRGRVEEFADYDGTPCALVVVNNASRGIWQDPIWVILDGTEGLEIGDVASFYLSGEGQTLPADGKYTRSGEEVEAPVARRAFFAK